MEATDFLNSIAVSANIMSCFVSSRQRVDRSLSDCNLLDAIEDSESVDEERFRQTLLMARKNSELNTKSDDISKFIGNVYLDCRIGPTRGDVSEVFLSSKRVFIDSIREQDFQLSNYYRKFNFSLCCLKQIIVIILRHVSDKVMKTESRLNTCISNIRHYHTELRLKLSKVLSFDNEVLKSLVMYEEEFDLLAEEVSNKLSAIKVYCDNAIQNYNEPGFYATINEVLVSYYNQFTKILSQILSILTETDIYTMNTKLNEYFSDPTKNMCLAENRAVACMQCIVQSLRRQVKTTLTKIEVFQIIRQKVAKDVQSKFDRMKLVLMDPRICKETDIHEDFMKLAMAIQELQKCELGLAIESSLGPSLTNYLIRHTTEYGVQEKGSVPLIRDFIESLVFKYTKHTHLIRHRMECSTVGTNKPCLLLLDVDFDDAAVQ